MSTPRPQYPLVLLYRVLNVSRSGYDAWRTRRHSTRAQENARLDVAIQAAPGLTRQTYGSERLHVELRVSPRPSGAVAAARHDSLHESNEQFAPMKRVWWTLKNELVQRSPAACAQQWARQQSAV